MLQHSRHIIQSNREVPTSLEILRPGFCQVAGDGKGPPIALSGLYEIDALEGIAQQRMSEESGSGTGA